MSYLFGKDQFKYYMTYNSIRTEVVFAPNAWEKNSKVSYTRNLEYFGVFRSWGLPLDFVYDGADILRQAYYNGSIQKRVTFEVEELNVSTLVYELGFVGDIDFSGAKDNGVTFSVTLMKAGATEDITAYDDVQFEYPLIGPDVVNVVLPGVSFTESSTAIFIPNIDNRRRFIPETHIETEAFQSTFVEVQNVEINNINDGEFVGNPNWFVKSNRNQFVKVKGKFTGFFFPGIFGSRGYKVSIMLDNAEFPLFYNNTDTGLFEFNFEINPLMIPDQKLYFYIRTDDNDGDQWVRVLEGEYEVSYRSVSDPSDCKGITAPNFFKRVMAKVSPSSTVQSFLLSNTWKDLVFTSGDAIREIEGAKIKFSLKDLFKTINGIDDAGLGIENDIIRLELASYFTRMIEICNVGQATVKDISPATKFMMSSIKIGYKDGNTDDLNGREEYNSGQVWQSPISRVQTPKDWISTARADQYGIEKIRTEYNVKKTSKGSYDIGSDNDTFLIDCYIDGDNYRPILGSSYHSVTGLSSPDTAYNLRLTPKQNLLRKGAYLHSVFNKMDQYFINFASGDKNTELQTVKDGKVVKENQNIAVASLPDPYFIPHIAQISCKLPFGARKLFDGLPFGYITFEAEGCTLSGFILDCNVDIAKNTAQEFELLLTPNSDLAKWAKRTNRAPKQII